MKKVISSLLSVLLFLSLPLTTITKAKNENQDYPVTNQIINILDINETVSNYFNNNLKLEKQDQIKSNDCIDKGSLLEQYSNLKYKLKNKINSKYNLKLENYTSKIKINSINYEDDLIKINVNNNVTCKYNSSDEQSYYEESHIIYLKNVNDKLVVERDICSLEGNASEIENIINNKLSVKSEFSADSNSSSSNISYESYMQKQIQNLNDELTNTDNYVDKMINSVSSPQVSPQSISGVTYDRSGAVSWALKNVYSSEDYSGNDCTNFVSKCICYGGGIPKDYVSGGWYQGQYAWIRVHEFWEWLVCKKGYACDYMSDREAYPGDIIQLYNENKQCFSHTLIITERRASLLYVSAHSNAAYNVPLTNYIPSSTYMVNRDLIFI